MNGRPFDVFLGVALFIVIAAFLLAVGLLIEHWEVTW